MKRITIIAMMLAVSVSALAQGAVKKYEVKSGIVKAVTTAMGQKIEAVSYFDDYGAVEVSKTKTTVPGAGEMEIAQISKDGKSYMVNYAAKQVQEIPVQESINYLNLTDEVIAKYKIGKIGMENVGDKFCFKYSAEISQMGQTASMTVWVWKGYPIKSVTSIQGMEITVEVTEFTENAEIAPETFEIPQF